MKSKDGDIFRLHPEFFVGEVVREYLQQVKALGKLDKIQLDGGRNNYGEANNCNRGTTKRRKIDSI